MSIIKCYWYIRYIFDRIFWSISSLAAEIGRACRNEYMGTSDAYFETPGLEQYQLKEIATALRVIGYSNDEKSFPYQMLADEREIPG